MSFDYDDELEHIEIDKNAWGEAFQEEKPGNKRGRTLNESEIERRSRVKARSMARQKRIARQKRKKRIITAIAVEILTLLFIFGYAYAYKIYSKPQRLEFKQDNIKNEELSVADIQKMKGYWMIAIFGVDSRGSNVGKGTNADVSMIACINQDTGDIKLVSVYRDTYLNLDDKGTYNKINQAYATGGPEQAVKALNKNLDLNITDYITFNWKGVADAINILGGVDVEITKAEFKYINSFITETVKSTGIGSYQLKSAGMNHLDGVQAVSYGRLRLMDTDYARTERQRKIIQLAFDKAKTAEYSVLNNILVVVLPQVATSLSFSDLTNVALSITKYKLGETGGFPFAKGNAVMGKKGDCVIPQTLESNVVELHKFLFGDEDYTTTDTVKKISSKIASDSGMFSQGKSQKGSQIPKDKDEPETSETRKTESSTAAETDEYGNPVATRPYETDEYGNPVATRPYETDEYGNPVATRPYETDEYGNPVATRPYETDEYGNPVATRPYETDEYGNPVATRPYETDEYGNPVMTGPYETDEYGNMIPSYTTGDGGNYPGESESGNNSSKPGNPANPGNSSTSPGQTRPTGPADLPTTEASTTKPAETKPKESTSGGPGQSVEPTAAVSGNPSGPVTTEPATSEARPDGADGTTAPVSPGTTPGGASGGGTPGEVIGNQGPG